MDNSQKIIKQFYDQNAQYEWDRLTRHPFEFRVTTHFMERYVKSGDSILDIGGGPGRYSLHFLKKGNNVTLTDLSDGNIEFAKVEAQQQGLSLQALTCDALHIREQIPGFYDHVFLMGPLYHLMTEEEWFQAVRSEISWAVMPLPEHTLSIRMRYYPSLVSSQLKYYISLGKKASLQPTTTICLPSQKK